MKKQKINKAVIVFSAILLLLSFLMLYIVHILDIGQWINRKFPVKEISELNLTVEQKLEDFDYLCNVLENGMPSMQIIESEYNIDYDYQKERYRKLIADSSTDYEFYCLVNAYMNLLPSAHTQFYYPDYEIYKNRAVHHIQNVLAVRGIEQYTAYWNTLLNDKAVSFEYEDYCSAQYMENTGKYYINDGNGGAEVISIAGIPVDEYVITAPLCNELKYDAINQKLVRDFILFTSDETEYSTKVTIKVKCANGDMGELELFAGLCNDFAVFNSIGKNKDTSDDTLLKTPEYEIADSEEYKLTYAGISKLNKENADKIKAELESRKYDTVILDLRSNSGGIPDRFFYSIYTPLVKEDAAASFHYYIPRTEVNSKLYFYAYFALGLFHDFVYRDLIYTDKTDLPEMNGKYVEYSEQYELTGNHNRNAEIYVLISNDTASSADMLASVLKAYAGAVVIGNATRGEGLGSSSVAEALPNSKLVFEYYPSIAYNLDGTCNTLHGTTPDHYMYFQNTAQKQIFNDLYNDQKPPFIYENRLKWDNVLIKTIEMIKEDENDKGNNTADQ